MLERIVNLQRSKFLNTKQKALSCTSPVLPSVDGHLAKLIEKSRIYQDSTTWVDGTDQMEATIASRTDNSQLRRVVISHEPQPRPSCCLYSKRGDGLPWYDGVVVLCEKYGGVNLHTFILPQNLTSEWKSSMRASILLFHHRKKMYRVIHVAKVLVGENKNVHILLAIAPPRGRPTNDAGIRRKSWYERGPSSKRQR